jgi:hypothetical protein
VPPSPTATSHHPQGGGPGQYTKDTLAGPAAAADDTPATATEPTAAAAADADLSSAGSELSTDEQLADELFYEPTEAAAEGHADLPNPAAAAAPEVMPRPSRSYSGEGVGQHEPGPAAAAAATQRSGSGGLMFGRAYSGPGLAMQPGVQVRQQALCVLLKHRHGMLICWAASPATYCNGVNQVCCGCIQRVNCHICRCRWPSLSASSCLQWCIGS